MVRRSGPSRKLITEGRRSVWVVLACRCMAGGRRRDSPRPSFAPREWFEGEFDPLPLAQVIERLQAHLACEPPEGEP